AFDQLDGDLRAVGERPRVERGGAALLRHPALVLDTRAQRESEPVSQPAFDLLQGDVAIDRSADIHRHGELADADPALAGHGGGDERDPPAGRCITHAVAGEALPAARSPAVPFAEPCGALQAVSEAQVVAEHRDAEAEGLLPVAQRYLVDEALDEEAGVAMGV